MIADRILLEGMVLAGRHGVLPAEREHGQRFVVDVDLRVDVEAAAATDDLGLTVDYRAVHHAVRAIVEGEPVDLLETLAVRTAHAILALDRRIEGVGVRVAKPDVTLGDTELSGSAVSVFRHR